MPPSNLFAGDFQVERRETGGRRLGPAAGTRALGASVYELAPGTSGLHLHAR